MESDWNVVGKNKKERSLRHFSSIKLHLLICIKVKPQQHYAFEFIEVLVSSFYQTLSTCLVARKRGKARGEEKMREKIINLNLIMLGAKLRVGEVFSEKKIS